MQGHQGELYILAFQGFGRVSIRFTHRLHSSSFLGLLSGILFFYHEKELQCSLRFRGLDLEIYGFLFRVARSELPTPTPQVLCAGIGGIYEPSRLP